MSYINDYENFNSYQNFLEFKRATNEKLIKDYDICEEIDDDNPDDIEELKNLYVD